MDRLEGRAVPATFTAVAAPAPPATDLAVVSSWPGPTAKDGDLTLLTLDVTNNGPADATGVVVTDLLPAGVRFNSLLANPSSTALRVNGQTVTMDVGNLAVGASAKLILFVQVTVSGTLTDMATVQADGADPSPANNMAGATIVVSPLPPPVIVTPPRVASFQRFGFHAQPTVLALTFDQIVIPTSVLDPLNTRVVDPGRDRRFGTRDDRTIPILTRQYDPTTDTLLIVTARR